MPPWSGNQGSRGTSTYTSSPVTAAATTTANVNSSVSSKLYQCQYCPYTSYVSTNLHNHIRTHTGEKPFPCSQCSYRATTRCNLKRHYMIHLSERNTARSYVPPSGALKSQYEGYNIPLHTNRNFFSCTFCSFQTDDQNVLMTHMASGHNK